VSGAVNRGGLGRGFFAGRSQQDHRAAVITPQQVPGYTSPVPTVSKHAIAADGDDVDLIAELPVPCTARIVGPMRRGGRDRRWPDRVHHQ
jgi:hypothetical protein